MEYLHAWVDVWMCGWIFENRMKRLESTICLLTCLIVSFFLSFFL